MEELGELIGGLLNALVEGLKALVQLIVYLCGAMIAGFRTLTEAAMASSGLRKCLECGAESRTERSEYCWLCDARLESPAHDLLRRSATAQQQAGDTIGLSTLMVVVALCAALFGVFRESRGLGILLAIVVTPALEAIVVTSLKRRARGRPMTGWQKLAAFAATFAVVVGGVVGTVVLIVVALRITWNNCWSTGRCAELF